MTLSEILRTKGSDVLTIAPDATLDDVVQTLVKRNCGSLVVCESKGGAAGPMLGIITERDILRALAAKRGPFDKLHVREVMTARPITGSPSDTVEQAMGLLTAKRIRHLPIQHEGKLVGMISIGDLVKAQHDQFAVENEAMKNYIQG